jgi:hypothetical protein
VLGARSRCSRAATRSACSNARSTFSAGELPQLRLGPAAAGEFGEEPRIARHVLEPLDHVIDPVEVAADPHVVDAGDARMCSM